MVAVLACGAGAVVSHRTAAELWRLRRPEAGPLDVSIPGGHRRRRRPGVRAHGRVVLVPGAVTAHQRVPTTSVTLTLVDLAAVVSRRHLEAAVNMADSLDLLDAEHLRVTLEQFRRVPGVAALRRLLDREAFRLTDSELERMFGRLRRPGRAARPGDPALHERAPRGLRLAAGRPRRRDRQPAASTAPRCNSAATLPATTRTCWPTASPFASPTTRSPTSRPTSAGRSGPRGAAQGSGPVRHLTVPGDGQSTDRVREAA